MNFGEPIVLLTAVHFHFSGFGASVVAGQTVRRNFPGDYSGLRLRNHGLSGLAAAIDSTNGGVAWNDECVGIHVVRIAGMGAHA